LIGNSVESGPCLRRLVVVGLSPPRTAFDPSPVHVGFLSELFSVTLLGSEYQAISPVARGSLIHPTGCISTIQTNKRHKHTQILSVFFKQHDPTLFLITGSTRDIDCDIKWVWLCTLGSCISSVLL